jgi:hypothetical protein
MVEVVKWTFAAARMACASERVIQSAAEGIGQSRLDAGGFDELPDLAGVAVAFDVDDSPLPVAAGTAVLSPSDDEAAALSATDEPDSADPSSPFEDAPVLIAARRSFLAQPVPR